MADQRLADAIGHWAPRFVANGIDLNDYDKLAKSIERWSDWCDAWCEVGAEHEQLGRDALDSGRTRSAGQHLAQAAVYYHFAKFMFVQDMDQLRAAHGRAVRCLDDALPYLDPPGERIEIPFEGAAMVGVLRIPSGGGPHPAVVLIAGLDSAKEELRPTEQLFLDRGLATFTVDGPGQGEAEYDLPIRPDWEVPGAAVIDVLEARPEIDGERIGLWGVSLGGYYAPRVASGDKRVRACVALSGPFTFGEEWDLVPLLTREAFQVRSRSTSDDEARSRALELTLEGRASEITCPLQIVTGRLDRIIPARHAERLASETGGPVDLWIFDDGGHVCTNICYRHRNRSADWMAEQLRS